MSTASVLASIDEQAIFDAFMQADAVRPSEAMIFEPKDSINRSMFEHLIKAGIIKPEGARWYLDLSAHTAAKRSRRRKAITVGALLAAAAGLIAIA